MPILKLEPMGDAAVLVHLSDESSALQLSTILRSKPPAHVIDVVPAYVSVAVFFDALCTSYAEVAAQVAQQADKLSDQLIPTGRLVKIRCCYELGPDLPRVAHHFGISAADVIRLHSEPLYTVYAVGFAPGFPYLGYLPQQLTGMPRLPSPRLRVAPGSVGLTGRQTGIYPLERPGGWNLVGRTPLELVNVADGYFPLQPGDRVQFLPISVSEFEARLGERVPVEI